MDRRQILKLLGLGLLGLKIPGAGRAWASERALMTGPNQNASEIVRGSRIMMGNIPVEITAVSGNREQAREAIAAAFYEMHRLENLMSIFKSESEISRLNAAAGKQPVKVSPEVMALIKRGLEVTKLTEGGFDIAIGSAVKLWDFLGEKHVPTTREVKTVKSACDSRDIVIDEGSEKIFLRKYGMMIDPGGIGKGYIVERAKLALKEYGVSSGIIAAAGDLVLFGNRPDGRPWRIGVRHPRKKDAEIAFMEMTDCAVSTSGDYERFFTKGGVVYHHILDPKTLFPARRCQSVTIIGDHGLFADSLATGVFVMGPKRGMAVLDKTDRKAIIIDDRGGVTASPALEGRVQFT